MKVTEQRRHLGDFRSRDILDNVKPVGSDLCYGAHRPGDFGAVPPSEGTGQQMELLKILPVDEAERTERRILNERLHPVGRLMKTDI